MGEKEGKGEEKQKKAEGEKKKEGGDGGGKKDEGPPPVVLKVDMHCEGCASKIKRAVRRFDGVEGVKVDMGANKLTATGNIDAMALRSYLEAKIRKKVELISPKDQPAKKDKDGDGAAKKPPGDDKDQKKPKAPQATTVVLKLRLHCEGCIQRIRRTIYKIKGVEDVSVDAQKDLVTVKGTMDAKSLPPLLKDKLKRSVEIVPPKKEGDGGGDKKEKGGGGGGDKKEKGGDGGGDKKDKGGDGGGEKKEKGGDGGGEKKEKKAEDGGKQPQPAAEVSKMEYYGTPYAPYGSYGYRVEMVHAPQLFSDENPNACSIM